MNLYKTAFVISLSASLISMTQISAHPSTPRYEKLSNLSSSGNWPTEQEQKKLLNELVFQRGSHVYLWALPLLNTIPSNHYE